MLEKGASPLTRTSSFKHLLGTVFGKPSLTRESKFGKILAWGGEKEKMEGSPGGV